MEVLEKYLKDLHAVIIDQKANNVINAVDVISDMDDYCRRISQDQIGSQQTWS